MPFESVSRYASLGVRTNLYSLLNGQFYMRDKDKRPCLMDLEKSRSQRVIVPMRMTIYFLHSAKSVRFITVS